MSERGSGSAIVVSNLHVVRGGKAVLPDLSLDVATGSVTGLLGPSGSGKTTLMRAIVGVQKVTGGSVSVLGLPAGARELRTRVAYVTQAPSVYGDLSVQENLSYFASVLGVAKAAIGTAMDAVGLGGYQRRIVGSLSGGERSRVSLATALLGQPDLLVLDEPTVGVDPVLRRDLWDTFHRIAAGGATLLVSSHVMDEAARCERLLLVREGRLLADSTPDELRAMTGTDDLDGAFLRLIEAGVDA
jgi:ABC-2 type transport system ATP-binding protein